MKLLLMLIAAMVLLSGAAWGCDWCLDPQHQANKLGISKEEATKRLNETMWDKFKHLPLKGKADDPTAWKHTDSKYGAEFESSVSPYWRPIK